MAINGFIMYVLGIITLLGVAVMMMITPNCRARKGERRGVWKNLRGGGGECDYEGMVQSSEQLVAPCVDGVESGLCTRVLRTVAAFPN